MKMHIIVLTTILLIECFTNLRIAAATGAPNCENDDNGDTQTCCGAYDYRPYPVNCASHGDTDSYCVYGDHCGCSDGFDHCPNAGGRNECSRGFVCVPKCDGSDCNCGVTEDATVDCSAHGDVDAFCVYTHHCKCSKGFQCPSYFDRSILIENGECHEGHMCTPIPPKVELLDLRIKNGKGNAKNYLKRVTDGDLTTNGNIKKTKKNSWVSFKASTNRSAGKWSVTVTPPQKEKKRKNLAGFEIWTGAEAGSLLIKCGGPYSKKDVREKPSITAVCNKGNDEIWQQKYITITIPGKKNTKIQIAELSVSQYVVE